MRIPVAAASRLLQQSVAGDYLDVVGPDNLEQVVDVVGVALRLPRSAWNLQAPFPWAHVEASMQVVIDYDSEGPGTVRVSVADDKQDRHWRRTIAQRLCRALTSRDWTVIHSTD